MTEVAENVSYPLTVDYCEDCTMPHEYCEYSGKKCKTACVQEATENVGEMTIDDNDVEKKIDDDKKHQKRGGKGFKEIDKDAPKTIILQKASRGKNKNVTVIKNLATHKVELKAATKFFSSKFACGSSIIGTDEVVIQGDVVDELFDVIPAKWKHITEDDLEDAGDAKK
uniref:SUI1 domain-containing protein n=1 Tax=Parastrongyloides trichosuri TaxID=131310 RepID=A0A0N4Z1X3_PARTI